MTENEEKARKIVSDIIVDISETSPWFWLLFCIGWAIANVGPERALEPIINIIATVVTVLDHHS